MRPQNEFSSLLDVVRYFKDEATCLRYVEEWMWDGKMDCPHCLNEKTYRFKNGVMFKCARCKKQFTAKIGTIFENTKIPMVKWMTAIYLIGAHKKGLSSHQLAKDVKVTQKTAWFMLHRIRKALNQENTGRVEGTVEVDETFVGGKNKNRHWDKKIDYSKVRNRENSDKTTVMGLMHRGGYLKTIVIPNVGKDIVVPILLSNVRQNSTVITDEWKAYRGLTNYFFHEIVNHSRKQYLNDNGFTTNSLEGFWAHLKRSIGGIYHWASKKHMQRYADESTFRYNTRKMTDPERFSKIISLAKNNRLTYKQLTYEPAKAA